MAKNAAGQTQVKLSNNQEFPAVCSFQVRSPAWLHTRSSLTPAAAMVCDMGFSWMLLQLTLTKTTPGPVALEALPGCISVSTIAQSPVSRYGEGTVGCCHALYVLTFVPVLTCCLSCCSLYHSLKDVYSPLLGLSEQQGRLGAPAAASSNQLNPRLQELLLQVQAGLGAAAKLQTPAGRPVSCYPGAKPRITAADPDHFCTAQTAAPAPCAAAQQYTTPYAELLCC